jgi:hypothetical protein
VASVNQTKQEMLAIQEVGRRGAKRADENYLLEK